jgi:hypothetical protein
MNSVQKKQLEQLQIKMNMLSKQITNLTGKFESGAEVSTDQSEKNTSGMIEGMKNNDTPELSELLEEYDNQMIGGYMSDIITTNNKINKISRETTDGIQNILKDSDIVVLQKNYEYLFWSILAAGTVLVSMNIVNKQ